MTRIVKEKRLQSDKTMTHLCFDQQQIGRASGHHAVAFIDKMASKKKVMTKKAKSNLMFGSAGFFSNLILNEWLKLRPSRQKYLCLFMSSQVDHQIHSQRIIHIAQKASTDAEIVAELLLQSQPCA